MNQSLDLVRSISIEPPTGDGRTLEGIAFRYDTPSLVSDGGAPYWEEFSRSAVEKTLRQRGTVPLLLLHDDRHRLPIGVATFNEGTDVLRFTARLSQTPDADDALTLVNDGALRGVSIRFRAYGSKQRSSSRGRVTVRTEIGLRELSLLPTGLGAHEGAEVLSVRRSQGITGSTPRLDALRKRRSLLITP